MGSQLHRTKMSCANNKTAILHPATALPKCCQSWIQANRMIDVIL